MPFEAFGGSCSFADPPETFGLEYHFSLDLLMRFWSIGQSLASSVVALCLFSMVPTPALSQAACSAPKDLFLNPFDRDSAHHRPIGTGARYADDNHPSTRNWLQASTLGVNRGDTPWGLLMVEAPGNGPVLRVNVRPGTPGNQLPANVRFPHEGVRIDFGTRDGNIAIFDRGTGRFQHLRNYTWNGGNPQSSQYRNYDPRSLGHGTRIGERIGTSASGVAAPFGILRGFEINTPGHHIGHALQMGLPSQPGCNIMVSRDIILPATSADGNATQAGHNTGNIPYGAVMALPPSVNINSLGLSEPGRRLAQAIRDYGIYVVDTAGCGQGAIRADQQINEPLRNRLVNSDMPKIYRHMRMVLNSEWRPNQAAVGGGQPIAPNCAYNARATNVAAPSTGQSSGGSAAAPAPSQQQSAAAPAPSQPQSSGNNAGSQTGTASGPDWEQAVRFWNWAQMSVPNMQRFAPGTPQHEQAKTNYDRNINNYIQAAARAGIRVDANTPPERAVAGSTAGSSSGGSAPATGNTQPSAPQQAQNTSGNQSAGGNAPPQPGTDAARFWQRATQFWGWAQVSVPNMQNFAPGTPQHETAKTNYQRNITLYMRYAARAGVSVNASTPPDRAFDRSSAQSLSGGSVPATRSLQSANTQLS